MEVYPKLLIVEFHAGTYTPEVVNQNMVDAKKRYSLNCLMIFMLVGIISFMVRIQL